MTSNIKRKKDFIYWMKENLDFPRREIYWILNYLANHDTLLAQIHFVEQVKHTPRGICFTTSITSKEGLCLFVEGHTFDHPEQIFHEIRMNWQDPLYIECVFESSWKNAMYLAVLEDNPFASWNDTIEQETIEAIENFLTHEEIEAQKSQTYLEINQALEDGNQKKFEKLSSLLRDLEEYKKN